MTENDSIRSEVTLVCSHADESPALSRYGHGDICSDCGWQEAQEGNFLSAKNTLIRITGEEVPLRDGQLTLEEMYAAIGCDIVERVVLKDVRADYFAQLWCDEEGLLKTPAFLNEKATKMYRDAYPDVPPAQLGIVGNAILTVSKF